MNLERIWSLVEYWEASGRATETFGRMQAGIEASRYSRGSGQKSTSSGRMMLGLSGRPDGMARRTDRWNSKQMSVQTGWHDRLDGWTGTENLLTCKQCRIFWIAESLIKQHLYIQVILSKQNEANHKLTNFNNSIVFQMIHLSDIVLGAAGQHILEKI
jgi:hypothetical protein